MGQLDCFAFSVLCLVNGGSIERGHGCTSHSEGHLELLSVTWFRFKKLCLMALMRGSFGSVALSGIIWIHFPLVVIVDHCFPVQLLVASVCTTWYG